MPEIRKWSKRLHLDDPTWYIEQMHGVDMDAVRSVAQEVWGTNAANAAIAAPQRTLEQLRDDLDKGLLTTIQDRWEGEAYLAFDEYVNVIQRAIQEEAERFPQVGEPLIEFADAFEVGLLEMIGHAVAAEGVLVGIVGVVVAVVAGGTGIGLIIGIIVALLGFVMAVISEIVTTMTSLVPRLQAAATAESEIRQTIQVGSPLELLPSFPSDIDDWIPKTPAPSD